MTKKPRYALFYMPEFMRRSIINAHIFYIEQAKKLLLKQFDELENQEKQRQVMDEWLLENQYRFNPDYHDGSEFYEEAFEQLQALYELGGQVRLSIVAGMYHEWEKQIKKWLTAEIKHWHTGENVPQAIWKANFGKIMEVLEQLGWDVKAEAYYSKLHECRLVTNVYKHGDGRAFGHLKNDYPEYFPLNSNNYYFSNYTDFADLTVNNTQLDAFSSAIVSFWENIPENIYDDDGAKVPSWLKKAFDRDGRQS